MKHAKKAFLASLLATLLCVTMLIGTTFAWFTDSVTSGGNIIKSGTLDVTMEWAEGTEAPDSATYTDASNGPIFNNSLWEPGYAEVKHIRIKNIGTLALKYRVEIIPSGDASELAKVIDVYYADPAVKVADRSDLADGLKLGTLEQALANLGTTGNGHLSAGESVTITLGLKMQETAGNEYQDKAIGANFSIKLLATQYTEESDSFNDQYDVTADYPIVATVNVATTTTGGVTTTNEAVTAATNETMAGTTTPLAAMTVPAGTAVTDSSLTLQVEETETPANFAVNNDQGSDAYDVTVTGLDTANNTGLIKVVLAIGTGKTNLTLYHNSTAMTKKTSLAEVVDDQDYFYDSAAGTVTFLSSTFSPFIVKYDKEYWYDLAAEGIANVDTTAKTVDIYTAEELAYFGKNVGGFNKYTVNIKADIDLAGALWTPISSFNGTINGGEHTISNMAIVYDGSYGNGFFSKFGNSGTAIMNDLTFEGATVQRYSAPSDSGNVYGIIAGYAGYYGSCEFHNVAVKNSTVYGFGKVGSFFGMLESSNGHATFDRCSVEGVKIYSGYNAGGYAGLIHYAVSNGRNTVTFIDCAVPDVEFFSVGVSRDGNIQELEGYEGTYSLYNGKYWYADTALYYNEYNAPTIREDMDAIVHNTPYNLVPVP